MRSWCRSFLLFVAALEHLENFAIFRALDEQLNRRTNWQAKDGMVGRKDRFSDWQTHLNNRGTARGNECRLYAAPWWRRNITLDIDRR
jgi:hypothetical protein